MTGVDPLIDLQVGNYRIVSRIGGGGMGEVYLAIQPQIGAQVAIKILSTAMAASPEAVERFMREAQAANRIAHDGIVKISDAGTLANGQPFLVMEMLDGVTLADRLARGPLSIADACRIAADVLDALVAAHASGIVHRDLKPGNIFLTRTGRTVVLDFGIARLLDVDARARLTLAGAVIGTPAYMAPEQIHGGDVGPAADLYAMGVVLYEMLCGARLISSVVTYEIMLEHVEGTPVFPAELERTLPKPLRAIILKALAKAPEQRFASAAEMRDQLRALAPSPPRRRAQATASTEPPTRREGPGLPRPRVSSRQRAVVAAIAAIAIAGTVVIAVAISRRSRTTSSFACVSAATLACTEQGAARGVASDGVVTFHGLPFAAPPIGPRRWQPPEPPQVWTGERASHPEATPCVQPSPRGAIGGEDCLYLDVYAPDHAAQRPVLVFVHGGDNLVGDRAEVDGRELARRADAIVVVPNYRLGVLGFLVHPAVGAGNYGLLDQIAALRWVRSNIAQFGGDPSRVVLVGQSAGAIDACDLLVSPLAAGLFARAILMSGSCFAVPAAAATTTGGRAVRAAGCTDPAAIASCMRAKSPTELLLVPGASSSDRTTGVAFYPSIDGNVMSEAPLAAFRAGRNNHVPLLIGTCNDEYQNLLEIFFPVKLPDEAAYRALIAKLYTTGAAAVLAAYPATRYRTPRDAFVAVLNDELAHCPARRYAREAARTDPVWRYLFAYAYKTPVLARLGAAHGHDVGFVFDDWRLAGAPPSAAEARLSASMIEAFAHFAATGDPGWPRYDAAERLRVFDEPSSLSSKFHAAVCDEWDYVAQ